MHRSSTGLLDCHWVGSLDFNFLENKGGFRYTPKSFFFAGGSTAAKTWSQFGQSRLLGLVRVVLLGSPAGSDV